MAAVRFPAHAITYQQSAGSFGIKSHFAGSTANRSDPKSTI